MPHLLKAYHVSCVMGGARLPGYGQEKAYGIKTEGLRENYTECILLFSLHFRNVPQTDFKSSQGSKIRHRKDTGCDIQQFLKVESVQTQRSFSVEFPTVVTSKV